MPAYSYLKGFLAEAFRNMHSPDHRTILDIHTIRESAFRNLNRPQF